MTLKNYVLNGPSVVILDDDRDPHVSWQNHLDRTDGARGGVDLVAAVGTPVYAPTDGVMDWRKNDGSAGNSCRFWHDDNKGWKDVFSHLSSYVGKDMQHFKQGELIAYSGNTGGVTQHLHRHLLDPRDVRKNPWGYFTPTAATASGTATPLAPIAQEDDMPRILNMRQTNDGINNTATIFFDGGPGIGIKPIANPDHLVLLQRFIADKSEDHMFPAELAIINEYIAPNRPTLDPATVTAAVTAAIKATGTSATAAAIATAVDAALRDDFAAIPGAVRSAIVK